MNGKANRRKTPMLALLHKYDLDFGRALANVILCTDQTANRRLRDTDELSIREIKLLTERGGIPIEEVRAAI